MRRRATRPNVFRGLKRFGVYSTDWKYILIPTGIAYVVPFVFGLWFGYVPLGFPLGLFTFLVLLESSEGKLSLCAGKRTLNEQNRKRVRGIGNQVRGNTN